MKKLFLILAVWTIFLFGLVVTSVFNPSTVAAQEQCNADGSPCTSNADGTYPDTCSPADCQEFKINIAEPDQGINPNAKIGDVLGNTITIIFVVAAVLVLFMLIFGAFQWITSGGEKEAVGKARGRIMHALIGLAILALAFLLVRVIAGLVHIDLLNLTLPALDKSSTTNPPPPQ